MSIKHLVRKCLWRAGWDVKRFDPRPSEAAQLVRQLGVHQVEVLFDVGANTGQFAEVLRGAGFRGRIVSFEPSTAAHAALSERARCDANWIVAPRVALGDHEGTVTLNLAGNSYSSSLLPMLPSHVTAAPGSSYIGFETVDLCTLDSIGAKFATETERVFLKLDVQGFESTVLLGAKQFLHRFVGIQIELSLVPLYDGESLFHPVLHDLEERGYEMWSLVPGILDPHTNRLLQLDAIFFRKEASLVRGVNEIYDAKVPCS
jgi:FkbM family methyltransferase